MPTASVLQTAAIKSSGLEVAALAGDKAGAASHFQDFSARKCKRVAPKIRLWVLPSHPNFLVRWSQSFYLQVEKKHRQSTEHRSRPDLRLWVLGGILLAEKPQPWAPPNFPRSKQGYKSSVAPPWMWPGRSVGKESLPEWDWAVR